MLLGRLLWFLLYQLLRWILLLFLPKNGRSDLISSDFLLLLQDLFTDPEVLMFLVIVHFDELGDRVQNIPMQLSLLLCRQLVL